MKIAIIIPVYNAEIQYVGQSNRLIQRMKLRLFV